MANTENMTTKEQVDNISGKLEEISLYMDNLKNENEVLKARNEELEKENDKLHDTILKMSQQISVD